MSSVIVFEISRSDLQVLDTPLSASITDVKPLTSYNWIEAPQATPTIAVPGSPNLWSAAGAPSRLKKDSGLIYIAQNAARHPESPLEPLFRALYVTHPSFDIRSIDVVTDRNNIRKLLSFIDVSSNRYGLEAFTINIEVIKNTAIFCRDEAKNLEYIGPQESRGFGHEFEKAYTLAQINGSTGHHRILSYRFGDLSFIVRHETDGYVDTETRTSASKTKNPTEDGLSSMLGALSLSSANIVPTGSRLMIKEEGRVVPLESTLEIKTRVSHKPLEIQEVAPQLWVAQTPKIVRAYHKNGVFQKAIIEDVTAAIKTWEECEQNKLRKLAALVRKIINLVKECGGNAVLKYDVEKEKLVLFKVDKKDMLPRDLYSKWDDVYKEASTQNEGKVALKGRESMSPTNSKGDDLQATIRIGDIDYNVHTSKMPYLKSFVRIQKATQPQATMFIHEPIHLFDVALKGVQSGFRQCFRSLPPNLSQYRTLFQTYLFLKVDILNGQSIDQVIANLKAGKADYDPEDRRLLPGNKALARDTAFQLLYLIFHPQPGEEPTISMKLFNAVMFVVSHPGTFKYRTKRVIRIAYEERFRPTLKQRARLDQWEKGENTVYTTDATTEEEFDYFDSDQSL